MEGNKQSGSSLTSDLFGAKDSSGSSPPTLFGSIFATPSKEVVNWKQDSGTQVWNAKGTTPSTTPSSEVASQWTQSSFYQEQKSQPSSLCSSIYYGGQDIYPHPQNKSEGSTFKKDIGEDEQGSVSIGNWWKGSFYY